jgi:hypothetical protein
VLLAVVPLPHAAGALSTSFGDASPPAARQAPAPWKISATDTGKPGPGAQTIRGGNVTLSLSAEGKPLSYTIGTGSNLLLPNNAGPGFYLTTGTGAAEKTFISSESKDGKLILTAADQTRVTLVANAGERYISFTLESIEDVPEGTEPILNFKVQFQSGVFPETVPFDYMCLAGGRFETRRSYTKASWPYYWKRAANDPPGGFAFFVPKNAEEHNEAILRIWTEENVPHPNVEGEWNYERAKQWAEEWNKHAEDQTYLMISAEKPEDLDPLIEFAKKLKVKRVFMHTDTWRGQYWPQDRHALSVNPKVFPRGEEDLKAFADKLKANGMGMMMHTLCYGIPAEGTEYLGKGKKPDRRLATWGKGTLEKPVSPTDTTILFRPDPGAKWSDHPKRWLTDVMIGDEIIQATFTEMDQEVWTLKDCKRGAAGTEPASHGAGTEVIGLIKAYGQNYYPGSMTDLPEITGRDYAEFFNRLGVQHHEYDGKESHDDVPWGFNKWSMFVYRNTTRPMTSNTSSGGTNPWDLMYRFKTGRPLKGSAFGCGSGETAFLLERNSRLATSPIENHFSMGLGAANNTPGFVFEKPEPMFGVFPNFIQEHGLVDLIAEQFSVWREITPILTPELRKQIADTYQRNPNSHHHNAKIVHEARRAGEGYELQPFSIMTRGSVDAAWTTMQEFGSVPPRQHIAPGMRISLDNPFGRQAPQFIIRAMNGYTDAAATHQDAPSEAMSDDLKGYLASAGTKVDDAAPPAPPATPVTASYRLQRKASQMLNPGRHVFADVGSALEVALDNSAKEGVPANSPKSGSMDHEQDANLPTGRGIRGNSVNASGLALTVTGDESGALLVIQVGGWKDYLIPIDFTGRKEIFIPCAEVSRTTKGWSKRAYVTKRSTYGEVRSVSIGFGRVPANTHAKVLIENLRMVGEKATSIKNPVIHAGEGTLAIQGEVQSSHYLWYQGGDTVGLYDKNWNHQADLPVVATNFEVDHGISDYWIDGESADPAPWFDVQFITKGETITVR